MRESTIEAAVCAYAKKQGCIVMKLSGMNQKGQPDRMFLRNGKSLFIEFKAPGNKPTKLQEKWLKDLSDAGFHTTWIDDTDNGKNMIDWFVKAAGGEGA